MSWQPHEPTTQTRSLVRAMSAYGVPQDQIALVVEIDAKTLRKYYRRELDIAAAEANAKVAETLFKQATGGNIAAAIFWLKSRAGWRETQQITIESTPTGMDLSKLTQDELVALKALREKASVDDDDTDSSGD